MFKKVSQIYSKYIESTDLVNHEFMIDYVEIPH